MSDTRATERKRIMMIFSLKPVRSTGPPTRVRRTPTVLRFGADTTNVRADMPEATRAHYAVETAIIEIVPDARILSWNNSRLSLSS